MFPSPLVCRPAPSRYLRGGVAVMGLLAALAVGLADLSWPLQALAMAATAAGVARALRVRPPAGLRCGVKGKLEVLSSDDVWAGADLLAGSALPFLLVLRYRPHGGGRSRSLVLGRDGLPPEEFRRLVVWLRWRTRGAEVKVGGCFPAPTPD